MKSGKKVEQKNNHFSVVKVLSQIAKLRRLSYEFHRGF